MQEQLNWETREYFLQLQEKFLKNKITIGEFCQAFSERDLLNSEAAGMLEYDPSSKSFWEGTTVHFSGTNAAQFYGIIQAQKFDWNILKLKNVSLGPLDLHYFRQSKARDSNQEVENFMEKSCQMIRSKSKIIQASWTRTKKRNKLQCVF